MESCMEALAKAQEAYHMADVVSIKHESHEQTCARRYEDWRRSTDELKLSIKGVYGILWTTSGVTIVTLLTGLGTLSYFLLTRIH